MQTRLHFKQQKHIHKHTQPTINTPLRGGAMFPGDRQALGSDVKRVIAVLESFIYLFRFGIWGSFYLPWVFFFFFFYLSHSMRERERARKKQKPISVG